MPAPQFPALIVPLAIIEVAPGQYISGERFDGCPPIVNEPSAALTWLESIASAGSNRFLPTNVGMMAPASADTAAAEPGAPLVPLVPLVPFVPLVPGAPVGPL